MVHAVALLLPFNLYSVFVSNSHATTFVQFLGIFILCLGMVQSFSDAVLRTLRHFSS